MRTIRRTGLFLLATLPLATTWTACKSTKQSSKSNHAISWQASAVNIDGVYDDWTLPFAYADSKALIQYDFSNDKDKLYIIMKTGDRATKTKILASGMDVWLDADNKKNKNIGVGYPLKGMLSAPKFSEKDQQAGGSGHVPGQAQQQLLQQATQVSLHGFAACAGLFKVSTGNPCGIEVKMGISDFDELVWEAAIPLKALSSASLDALQHDGLSIDFDIKAFSRTGGDGPVSHGGGGGMHAGGGGMGGGMGGGGMRGGGGGMGGHMRSGGGSPSGGSGGQGSTGGNFEETNTWAKIRLNTAAH